MSHRKDFYDRTDFDLNRWVERFDTLEALNESINRRG